MVSTDMIVDLWREQRLAIQLLLFWCYGEVFGGGGGGGIRWSPILPYTLLTPCQHKAWHYHFKQIQFQTISINCIEDIDNHQRQPLSNGGLLRKLMLQFRSNANIKCTLFFQSRCDVQLSSVRVKAWC